MGHLRNDLVAVGLAIALLAAATLRARRRAARSAVGNDEEYSGPEPTEAEVAAAEQSIRSKTADAVRRAKATAVKSILAFLFLVAVSIPFMHGMPLNSIFRPWGQLLLVGCALTFAWAMFASFGFVSTWSFKRNTDKLLNDSHGQR